ncbi:hypothetical protein [Breznakia pachnodae]|uniref:Uncharacterized protein n=1 Tax=Breznakia pachnodae TaxID=265178 RepID=A0ABU0E5T1_9FIRM|nr:hypothetical protein [Breznakia pachnodae]MDQ0361865.1 hypothetical protein [Breznakia pachnodae]
MNYNELKHKVIKLAASHGIIIKELDLNENEPNALIIKNYIGIKKYLQVEEWLIPSYMRWEIISCTWKNRFHGTTLL